LLLINTSVINTLLWLIVIIHDSWPLITLLLINTSVINTLLWLIVIIHDSWPLITLLLSIPLWSIPCCDWLWSFMIHDHWSHCFWSIPLWQYLAVIDCDHSWFMTIDHIASDQYLCDQYLAVIDCDHSWFMTIDHIASDQYLAVNSFGPSLLECHCKSRGRYI